MQRTARKDAARPAGTDRNPQSKNIHITIISPAQILGNCISCGSRITLVGGATTCPTCSAWRRWYSAHRIAAEVLRRASR